MSHDVSLLDLRDDTNHPLSLRYSEIYTNALVNGYFKDGRVQPSLTLLDKAPFVLAGREAVKKGIYSDLALEAIYNVLDAYYEMVQPANAADWLGIAGEKNIELQHAPAWGAVLPWRARSLSSYQNTYEKAALEENRLTGREIGIEDGWFLCGPVSKEKIIIESERILHVLRQIDTYGYKRSDSVDGDVKATALIGKNQEWKWLITSGNHRAAAAAALGYESIPIRVNLVISRSDVMYWKHVVTGLFTQEQALEIFDNIFDARSVSVLKQWQIEIN